MLVLHVTVQVKPERLDQFLEAVRYDAIHSERDEPGCLRFDIVQDRDDPNRLYFYEVYRDEAALETHRQTTHFKLYAEQSKDWLAAPPQRRFGKNLIPDDTAWR